MSEVKATREAVFAAADAIKLAGDRPTIRKICERTGGSYTTVKNEFEAWQQSELDDKEAAATVPESVLEKSAAFGRALWHIAQKHAQQALEEAEARFTAENAKLSQDLEFAQIEISKLEAAGASQAEKLNEAQASILRMQRELGEVKSVEAKVADLESRISSREAENRLLRQEATEAAREAGRREGEADALRAQVREMTEAMAKGRSATT